jgi:hypothetical protein
MMTMTNTLRPSELRRALRRSFVLREEGSILTGSVRLTDAVRVAAILLHLVCKIAGNLP